MTEPEAPARPGSSIDLSRRMDRMEQNHEQLAKEVAGLAGTISRVEINQKHAEELNVLRFTALDTAVKSVEATLGTAVRSLEGTLGRFMDRINSIITGETRLPQNDALMQDYRDWRADVDEKLEASQAKLEEQAVLNGQVRLLGRLAVLLVSGNVLAIIAAVAAVLK